MSFSTFCMKKLNAFKYWHRIKRCVCGDCLATIVNLMVSCIFPLSSWQINFALKLVSVDNWSNQVVASKHILILQLPAL